MNILFLSIGRLNSILDKGIYSDLLREFRNQGHEVYIVTPLEKRTNKETSYFVEDDVHYLKVKIGNITKTNLIEKGVSTLRIETLFLKAIKKNMSNVKFDLILYSTPPITFEKVIRYIKNRDNAKSYLLLKDIFPQNAVDLKIFSETSIINKYFRYKEKKLYLNSDFIGCMSPANVKFIVKNNTFLKSEKIEVCPNSIEPLEIKYSYEKKKEIRKKFNIPLDKTIFIYGGNLGKPQGIDYLIECLETNRNNKDVYFIIAGSGTEYNKLNEFFVKNNINNAQLFKQLPKEEYEILANSCDVGLIFLDNRFTIPNFPSRLLSYMQASMPVLAATDINTDIGEIIEQGEFGYWCESKDVKDFNKKLLKFTDETDRNRMGSNARLYLENNYTAKHSYEIIMKHFT
ncbi:glycosyltransferase family 4 protein [Solibacillus sp. FSL W7-1436]|uniref:glycosyltransferase family 4 protein n=1 Tax=Solibacillus sp. FSL W7-1436 TaxID=2921705 RepID=UPI0030F9EF66